MKKFATWVKRNWLKVMWIAIFMLTSGFVMLNLDTFHIITLAREFVNIAYDLIIFGTVLITLCALVVVLKPRIKP